MFNSIDLSDNKKPETKNQISVLQRKDTQNDALGYDTFEEDKNKWYFTQNDSSTSINDTKYEKDINLLNIERYTDINTYSFNSHDKIKSIGGFNQEQMKSVLPPIQQIPPVPPLLRRERTISPLKLGPSRDDLKEFESPTPVDDNGKKLVIFVLDKSGSMMTVAKKMKDAINDTIADQKKIDNFYYSMISLYNCSIINDAEITPLKDAVPLIDYSSAGFTNIFDTVGYAIEKYQNFKDVLLVIITDGMDNTSVKYNKKTIKTILNDKRKIGWNIMYLSQNLEEQGVEMGITNTHNSRNISCGDKTGLPFLVRQISRSVSEFGNKKSKEPIELEKAITIN